MLCTVGLTGGLASGKSTVVSGFARRGAAVIDADAVVHQLYKPGGAGAAAVEELFGPEVLREGGVDRNALAARVLDDHGALAQLSAAIHPLVRSRIGQWLRSLPAGSRQPPMAVVEAALLVETGAYRAYDLLVVVWSHPEQQLQRAMARGGDRERTRRLLAAQSSMAEKRRLADVEIDNSGSPEELEGHLDRAWAEIIDLCPLRQSRKE